MLDCSKLALIWVHEIQFSNKLQLDTHMVSSKDYEGPVPGLCWAHMYSGAPMLAETVYLDRQEMLWGFRPTHWFVVFTDGSKTGGECLSFDPPQTVITEEHIPSEK
jgi:hypothetical protein